MEKVGKDGVITMKKPRAQDGLDVVEGMQFDRLPSPYFVTDSERMEVALKILT